VRSSRIVSTSVIHGWYYNHGAFFSSPLFPL
jgi:hypothetical protein